MLYSFNYYIFSHFHGNKGCRNTFLGILRFISQGYDIEGWHNALNRGAGSRCRMLFYSLIELLDREARITAISIRLVSDKKLKRIQRKRYRELQAKLFSQWEMYANHQKTAVQLLKVCSQLNGPARCSVNLTETSICENFVHRFSMFSRGK